MTPKLGPWDVPELSREQRRLERASEDDDGESLEEASRTDRRNAWRREAADERAQALEHLESNDTQVFKHLRDRTGDFNMLDLIRGTAQGGAVTDHGENLEKFYWPWANDIAGQRRHIFAAIMAMSMCSEHGL